MQMTDLAFNFEIHNSGQFVWNPYLVYLGGSTSFVDNVDPVNLVIMKYKIFVLMWGQLVQVDFIILFLEVIWSKG